MAFSGCFLLFDLCITYCSIGQRGSIVVMKVKRMEQKDGKRDQTKIEIKRYTNCVGVQSCFRYIRSVTMQPGTI